MQEKVNELFPYPSFGFRLEHKDGKSIKICWFECKEHLDKYVERYKLKKKDMKIESKNKTVKKKK